MISREAFKVDKFNLYKNDLILVYCPTAEQIRRGN